MPKATKATWPREAPFFEFIGRCRGCRGTVVEGFLSGDGSLWVVTTCGGGEWPMAPDIQNLKPLTPTAIAMSAIAKESA